VRIWAIERSCGVTALGGGQLKRVLARLVEYVSHLSRKNKDAARVGNPAAFGQNAPSLRDSGDIFDCTHPTLKRGANNHCAYSAGWLADDGMEQRGPRGMGQRGPGGPRDSRPGGRRYNFRIGSICNNFRIGSIRNSFRMDSIGNSFRIGSIVVSWYKVCRKPVFSSLGAIALSALVLPGMGWAQSGGSWQALGPKGVISQNYGLVTGRIAALALDPSDVTGNTLFVGTTGGGVWRSQNAGTSSPMNITFTPLTDNLPVLSGAQDASISIGALSVQPGGTGVVLAGTGDPNDALDSYYGAGILRSADGGNTWSLITATTDQIYSFVGEGIAGFAWSTLNPQRVVVAVSQALEGTLVNALGAGYSYEGLYYSSDGGASWTLAKITDGSGSDVQGPGDSFIHPDGNAATSVVWNPIRKLFIAAVRHHGYYQSTDGITFTRMAVQPGAKLAASAGLCLNSVGSPGPTGCPIFRGTLAVNPLTGDTFAWTVDEYNQDQGIWQDLCVVSANACTNLTITFAQQWNTAALEANTLQGPATIMSGDYNLSLAAVPSGQVTMLLAGASDLWKTMCPYSQGCRWRNTTNSTIGFCAQVGEYQHTLAWNASNPLEIFVGNDSGLWRSTDAIGETGSTCAASDATHFQNLNGSLGSLGEVISLSQTGATPYTMMASLGMIGTAGVNSSTGPTTDWPEILGGEGGPVAIDPVSNLKWYVNNGAGVSIYQGMPPTGSTPGAFTAVLTAGTAPTANVVKDGYTMSAPSPFLVDPADHTQLLIGTCRVWRGPANGVGWSDSNAISPILGGVTSNTNCNGDAEIRTMAALPQAVSAALPSGGEIVYVGMYGTANGGATLPGHVLSGTMNFASSAAPAWTDLTLNPVTNDTLAMNYYGMDISSIVIDSHDATGKTVYVTVAEFNTASAKIQTVYGTTDGGAHWASLTTNLPAAPVNSLAVDPQDANTVYVATDAGVYSTRQISNCSSLSSACWSAFGGGLPPSPVVQISAAPATASVHNLVAATYGRGVWMIPLWTATEDMTTATVSVAALTFASQIYGSTSSAQTVTVKNTGSLALTTSYVSATGDFSATGNCGGSTLQPGGSCTVQVSFTPEGVGSRTGVLTIYTNVTGGELTVALSGTGAPSGAVSLTPGAINFNGSTSGVLVGQSSALFQVTASNSGSPALAFTSTISAPFSIATNSCGSSIPAGGSCNLTLLFTPTQAGAVTGSLTFTDASGTQTVALSGTGLSPATDTISATTLAFPSTVMDQLSAAQTVTLTNNGGVALTSISISVSGTNAADFQVTNPCTAILGANSSCAINVQFDPSVVGPETATLIISSSAADSPKTVALSGTGLQPAALGVSPPSLSFNSQTVGQASAPQAVTVTNTGGATAANVGFQITGLSATSFSMGTNTCGATLASGANCSVQIIFTPAAAGGSSASLVVSSSTSGVAAVTVSLTGGGLAPAGLNVTPAQISFPVTLAGQSSLAPTPVTLTNTGQSPTNALNLSATPPFGLVLNTCQGTTLAAGGSCTVWVNFTPQVNGNYTGTMTVQSPSASVALSGTGGTPGSVNFQPSLLSFMQTGVGQTSGTSTVTITNPDPVNYLSSLLLTPTTGFQLVSTTCSTTLSPGASCTASVAFKPLSAGPQSGSLTVTSSALPTGSFLALSGVGSDFIFTPSGSSSQAVANGQIAYFTLLVTPLNGSQGVFSFQCGTPLPPSTSCTPNPATEGIPANTVGNVIVGIATGLTQTNARSAPPSPWPAFPPACGLALLPLALRKRRGALLLIVLMAVLAGGVSSCTQSSGGSASGITKTGTGITPPASYAIVVTASSNGVSHQVTLTLTVD